MSGWNDPREPVSVDCVRIFGVEVRTGDRVRLWPQKNADILDMALKGKVAIVEAIESDYDNNLHLAVVLEDDPGREFGMLRQPGHRFFFSPAEVEPLPPQNAKSGRVGDPASTPKRQKRACRGARGAINDEGEPKGGA